MKKKTIRLLAGLLAAVTLTACGTDPEITQFKKKVDTFCTSVAELNKSINEIDAQADDASELALAYLDQLDKQFQDFAELDFPEDYDYLESLADEAGNYMKEAVNSYHEAYEGETYDEDTAAYARENSARALKRVQIILSILRGEDPSENQASSETE